MASLIQPSTLPMLNHIYDHTKLPKPQNPSKLCDHIAPFFVRTAATIKHLKARMTVDFVHGEPFTVLEKLRHGVLESRMCEASRHDGLESDSCKASMTAKVDNFPSCFDRIHMSNVP